MMNNQPRLTISLVTYNGEKYLPYCLGSLFEQTFQDFNVILIDNGSGDNTVNFIKEKYPQIRLVTYDKNLGFAKSHNQAIAWSKSEYITLLNQDIILDNDYLARVVEFLDNNAEASAVAGKILKWDFKNNEKTQLIDSLGLKVFKNHRVIEIGQGTLDVGEAEEVKEVFGLSGALPTFRKQDLEKIKVKLKNGFGHEEYFDEDFFAYKEDIDLSYRLRLAGLKSIYLPTAKAWHDRSIFAGNDLTDAAVRKSRKDKHKLIKMYSYRNHLLCLFKNEFSKNLWLYSRQIFWYELKKLVYVFFMEKSSLEGLNQFFKQSKKNKAKRRYIFKNIVKVQPEELSRWYE